MRLLYQKLSFLPILQAGSLSAQHHSFLGNLSATSGAVWCREREGEAEQGGEQRGALGRGGHWRLCLPCPPFGGGAGVVGSPAPSPAHNPESGSGN